MIDWSIECNGCNKITESTIITCETTNYNIISSYFSEESNRPIPQLAQSYIPTLFSMYQYVCIYVCMCVCACVLCWFCFIVPHQGFEWNDDTYTWTFAVMYHCILNMNIDILTKEWLHWNVWMHCIESNQSDSTDWLTELNWTELMISYNVHVHMFKRNAMQYNSMQ